MPQQDKSAPDESIGCSEYQGKEFVPRNREELEEALKIAFDYRGDITIHRKDGTQSECFIFNYNNAEGKAQVFFVEDKKSSNSGTVDYEEIKALSFTGDDKAFGKSWDSWMAKSAKQRKAEAERLEKEAEAQGFL